MRLIAELLSKQDPAAPHTWLTRLIVSGIIVFASVVYAGFFGVLGAVCVYLLGVELMDADLRWLYLPIVVSLALGLRGATKQLRDYWRNYGHGTA